MYNTVDLVHANEQVEINQKRLPRTSSKDSILTPEEISERLNFYEDCSNETTKSDKVKIIRQMMNEGKRVEEIAVRLQVSSKTIYRICERDICKGNRDDYKKLLKGRKKKIVSSSSSTKTFLNSNNTMLLHNLLSSKDLPDQTN